MSGTILIISDSAEAGRVWAYALRQRGHRAHLAAGADEALRLAAEQMPNLAVIDGYAQPARWLELCQKLRGQDVSPILLLASGSDETYILDAYARGVDEVTARPLSPLVFLAKVESWLRRSRTVQSGPRDPLTVGSLILTPERRELRVNGDCVHRLTTLELRLLRSLMAHPGQALSADALIERVWGTDGGDADMLKNLVYRLRRKIEPDNARQHYIITAPGHGYRLRAP